MEEIYNDTIRILFYKEELMNFHILAGNIQEFFHQPAHFDDQACINNFYIGNYDKLKFFYEFFKNGSDLFERKEGDYCVLTSMRRLDKMRSCITLIYLIFSTNNYALELKHLYNSYDYRKWRTLYFEELEHWMNNKLEDELYPDSA